MFKKLQRNLERKKEGKTPIKFRFDVQVKELQGVPASVDECRVVWSRGAKVQMTDLAHAHEGVADFGGQLLAQVATVYKGTENSMESKEYTFKIQIPKDDKTLTMGKGIIDLGQHASLDSEPKNLTVPIKFAAGSRGLGNGELLITVNSEMMKGFSAEDGMTVMSGLSGLSSPFDNQYDQDLSGFDSIPEDEEVHEEDTAQLPNVLSGKLSSVLSSTAGEALQSVPSLSARGSLGEVPQYESTKSHPADISTNSVAADVSEMETRIQDLEEQVASQKKVKVELENQLKESMVKAEKDISDAKRQLEGERAEKVELEAQLKKEIETAGEEAVNQAVEKAVAVWEVRFQKLREEAEVIRARANEELDEAQEHLLSYQEQAMELDNQLRASERARENMLREKHALETTLMEASSDRMDLERVKEKLEKDLKDVHGQVKKGDNSNEIDEGTLMTELIDTKVRLAELDQMHTVVRRELYKSRETNMLLASKMTKLETYLYKNRQQEQGRAKGGKAVDKTTPLLAENGNTGNEILEGAAD